MNKFRHAIVSTLQALSEAIAKSPGASDFVACEASSGGEKWLREAGDARVRNLYSDFIKKFKHRCLREVRYVYSPRQS